MEWYEDDFEGIVDRWGDWNQLYTVTNMAEWGELLDGEVGIVAEVLIVVGEEDIVAVEEVEVDDDIGLVRNWSWRIVAEEAVANSKEIDWAAASGLHFD